MCCSHRLACHASQALIHPLLPNMPASSPSVAGVQPKGVCSLPPSWTADRPACAGATEAAVSASLVSGPLLLLALSFPQIIIPGISSKISSNMIPGYDFIPGLSSKIQMLSSCPATPFKIFFRSLYRTFMADALYCVLVHNEYRAQAHAAQRCRLAFIWYWLLISKKQANICMF